MPDTETETAVPQDVDPRGEKKPADVLPPPQMRGRKEQPEQPVMEPEEAVIVDHERAWMELKTHILSKNSHGQRELLSRMAQVEVDCRVPEGERGYDGAPPIPRAQAVRSGDPRVGVA